MKMEHKKKSLRQRGTDVLTVRVCLVLNFGLICICLALIAFIIYTKISDASSETETIKRRFSTGPVNADSTIEATAPPSVNTSQNNAAPTVFSLNQNSPTISDSTSNETSWIKFFSPTEVEDVYGQTRKLAVLWDGRKQYFVEEICQQVDGCEAACTCMTQATPVAGIAEDDDGSCSLFWFLVNSGCKCINT